jgi:LytS/YehU family sensor histidine kinase
VASAIAAILQLPAFYLFGEIFPYEEKTIFGRYVVPGILTFRGGQFLGWSLLYFGIKVWLDKESDEKRLEEEQAKRNEAELLMLRSLINSHFLVNSLNTVLNVLERQTQGAREMVQSLSDYLNYSLRHRRDNLVRLGEEVEALEDYLALEKARLGHELDFSQQVEADLRSTNVPGFLLQPLIENAIKYGRETCHSRVLVRLMIQREGDDLLLQVCNTGKWIEPDPYRKSGGIGLEVIQRKLAWMYPNRHSLTTLDEEGWVTVQIKIPIIP